MSQFNPLPRSSSKPTSYGKPNNLGTPKHVGISCMPSMLSAVLVANQLQVKGLDGLIGTQAWADIVPFVQKLRAKKRPHPLYHLPETGDRPLETVALNRQQVDFGRASAYLKIGDGCSAPCTFCAIPNFKGPNRSRPRRHILAEARRLAEAGVREIIIIARS